MGYKWIHRRQSDGIVRIETYKWCDAKRKWQRLISDIKSGDCAKCGNDFWWWTRKLCRARSERWEKWSDDPEDWPEVQKWWFSFGNLCKKCAPSFDEWQSKVKAVEDIA